MTTTMTGCGLGLGLGACWALPLALLLAFALPLRHAATASSVDSLVRSLDLSVEPCQDFYRFTCGGYEKRTVLPEDPDDGESASVIGSMEARLKKNLNALLAEPASEDEPATFKKAKALYKSCMDTAHLEEVGLQPARAILDALGGWPVLEGDAWDESKSNWTELSYKFEELGLYGDFLFGLGIQQDIGTGGYNIDVTMPELVLDVKNLDEAELESQVYNYRYMLVSAVQLLLPPNSTVTKTRIQDETEKIAIFEMELNSNTMSLEDRLNVTLGLNPMNTSELERRYPYVPWRAYISRVIPTAANMTDEETVNVSDPPFMDALGTLLASTPKRTVINYMVWRALQQNVLPYLNEEARNLQATLGQRSAECTSLVQERVGLATSAMYIRRHSSAEVKRFVTEIVLDIRREMHRMMEELDWMDAATRSAAVAKVDEMSFNVAFPNELLNDTALDEQFEGVEIQEDDLLGNVLTLLRVDRAQNTGQFHQKVKKQDWTGISGVSDAVNAFYSNGDNSLSIQAGIIQPPFFALDRPLYLNYGSMGSVAGHEASHGFDETGSTFNAHGRMENWWNEHTKDSFDAKVQCMIDMFNGMRSERANTSVNGVLIKSETIADSAGLDLAYRAYKRRVQRDGEEAPFVVNATTADAEADAKADAKQRVLTPRQMFWVSFGTLWCVKNTDRAMRNELRTSDHPTGEFRVNGAVQNQPAFAEDFNCPVGSPMNPAHRCRVWA